MTLPSQNISTIGTTLLRSEVEGCEIKTCWWNAGLYQATAMCIFRRRFQPWALDGARIGKEDCLLHQHAFLGFLAG